MKKFIKQSKNGTIHNYYTNGKITTIHSNNIIIQKIKRIFKTKKTIKDFNLKVFFYLKKGILKC
ncbi:hypothetical protein [Candidatus Phytoplasma sp. AldY-WA1]|uniref:hypothetical protein n=1 Tax=Candidatus Phytoplasma sp. AldY-WA1 TaxID=2852100 RepID=UPI002549DA82|nr:hypothetical protein [Candidatus Phytoplasma sp. AldY-WA1]